MSVIFYAHHLWRLHEDVVEFVKMFVAARNRKLPEGNFFTLCVHREGVPQSLVPCPFQGGGG